ncbi:alpha/beta fold hydrolase [Pseudoalteromonas sp. McH1-42]|uniref:S9 family peptidase n=1 Tax=Pseudoalteromonas sp. McH1-42 TaxID=2917752 RepID=UPI001EF49D2A|nr:alpha/beta fold hydrolase [Pseudoalteromonas sp. McH1-42]MCG7560167.1 alpha/beta fold hydrolase [Pseudoalteromonas sp. McH1-42]
MIPLSVDISDASHFHENTTLTGLSCSYDGRYFLLSSDQSGCANVYRVATEANRIEQLTHFATQPTFAISYFPRDSRFLYRQDQCGDELDHIWVHEPDGQRRDLTPGDGLKASFLQWNDSGEQFWLLHNQRDASVYDVYCYCAADYTNQRVFTNCDQVNVCDISRDGVWLACEKELNSRANQLVFYRLDTSKGKRCEYQPGYWVGKNDMQARHMIMSFAPDSQSVFYTSDLDCEHKNVWVLDLVTGKTAELLRLGWDVTAFYFSPSGRYQICEVNRDAKTCLQVTDTNTQKPYFLSNEEDAATGLCFSPDESRIGYYTESCICPANLHIHHIGGSNNRLIQAQNPKLPQQRLVRAEVVHYRSFDGLSIPALLYRPSEASADNPVAAMLWIHGGPGDQSQQKFDPVIQHLVSNGYAVLAVNHRGSTGYGKTFFHMADRQHGDVDLEDCLYAKHYLGDLDWVDGQRIGIMGCSYGGFLALAALTFKPDIFALAINIFGVTNWLRTLNSIPPWMGGVRKRIYDVMGDPAQDHQRLKQVSPLFHASQICRPLLVVQGKNDQRVLQIESDEIVQAVKRNGVPVEYLLFEDEGHGFNRRANLIAASNHYLNFLNQYL